jgi:hypothetical protein
MKTSRLKQLLIIIWGSVFALGALAAGLFFWMQSQPAETPPPTASIESTRPTLHIEPSQTVQPTGPARPSATSITAFDPSRLTITPLPAIGNIPAGDLATLPPGLNPLTGLTVEDASRLERVPIAVKITTFPRGVRAYQYGLSRADVAYEYYIEDGLTRFIAVFYGKDAEKAGPVRSGRYFDEHIMRMYQSYLVFANADERVEARLLSQPELVRFLFLPRGDNCPPLCRDGQIKDYNNFFLDTAGLTEYQRKIGHLDPRPPLRPTFFSASLPAGANFSISRLYTRYSEYSYHFWEYDPARRLYLRFSDAADSLTVSGEQYGPHIDQLTGQQVTAENVVVLVALHNFKDEFQREDQVFDIDLTGGGQAYLFRNGFAYPAFWERDELNQPIRLTDMAGNPIGLATGVTFYIVVNPETSLLQTEDNVRFTFSIPARRLTPTPSEFPTVKPSPTKRK